MSGARDVFFSYHTASSLSLVQETAKMLEALGLRCWYAQRDIKAGQNYTSVIPEAIDASTLVVVLVNQFSIQSDQMASEVNLSLDKKKPIILFGLDESSWKDNKAFYVAGARSQVISITPGSVAASADQISHHVFNWFEEMRNSEKKNAGELTKYKTSWDTNDLEFFGDEGERYRIGLQHQFVYTFAKDAYDELLSDPTKTTFLDVGCNTGAQSKMFLADKSHIRYVGIDREEAALQQAAEIFPDGHMYVCDCEAEDFSKRLREIENELGIDGFDTINVSMLLLHTKNPAILIDVLSDHLSENGQMIVLDIDDGFTVAHPDPEGMFEKAIRYCYKTEYSGFRHCGRAINKFFVDTDLQDIRLHRLGLSNVGLSRKEREDLFEVYFWFVLDDLKKMSEENPDDQYVYSEYAWMRDHYASMKNAFKKKEFFFTLGFVLYSAHP